MRFAMLFPVGFGSRAALSVYTLAVVDSLFSHVRYFAMLYLMCVSQPAPLSYSSAVVF